MARTGGGAVTGSSRAAGNLRPCNPLIGHDLAQTDNAVRRVTHGALAKAGDGIRTHDIHVGNVTLYH